MKSNTDKTKSLMEAANKVTNAMPISEAMGAPAMGGRQAPKPGAGQLNYRWHQPQRNLGNPLVLSSSDQLGSYMLQDELWKEHLMRKWQQWYNQHVAPWQDQYPAP